MPYVGGGIHQRDQELTQPVNNGFFKASTKLGYREG